MKLKDVELKRPKVLFYGPPGSGKTGFVLTLGEHLTIIDIDDGLLTGKRMEDEFKDVRVEAEVKPCWEDNPIQKPIAFQKAESYIKGFSKECREGNRPTKALAIDSLTTLMESALHHVQKVNGRAGERISLNEWGLAINGVKRIMAILKSIPAIVILVCHEDMYEVDGETKVRMSVQGRKLPAQLPAFFDEVWRARVVNLEGGKTGFRIQTKGTASCIARSRCNLPNNLDMNIGMPEVLKLMGYKWDDL